MSSSSPPLKKARLDDDDSKVCGDGNDHHEEDDVTTTKTLAQHNNEFVDSLVGDEAAVSSSRLLPESLCTPVLVRGDLDRLQELLKSHGLRTAKVSSPRPALSVYMDSARQSVNSNNHMNNHSTNAPRDYLDV